MGANSVALLEALVWRFTCFGESDVRPGKKSDFEPSRQGGVMMMIGLAPPRRIDRENEKRLGATT